MPFTMLDTNLNFQNHPNVSQYKYPTTLHCRIITIVVLINFQKIGPPFTAYLAGCVYFFTDFWSYSSLILLCCVYFFHTFRGKKAPKFYFLQGKFDF